MKTRKLRKEATVEFRLFLLSCFLCFVSGFFASQQFLQKRLQGSLAGGGPRRKLIVEEVEPPTVVHGHTVESQPASIPFQVLSWKPRAFHFPGFATKEQCEVIIETARARLEPSELMFRQGETPENTKGIRTRSILKRFDKYHKKEDVSPSFDLLYSTGTFLRASEDLTGTLEEIEQKIARASLIPRENGEPFNVIRYEIGQRYASHYDAFNPAEYGPQTSNRVATFILYLSDVEEGGETIFPFENGSNMDIGYDYEKCIGLKIDPNRGDGLLFFSTFLNQTIDPTSLHGSCPVRKGEKWVVTKWMRDEKLV